MESITTKKPMLLHTIHLNKIFIESLQNDENPDYANIFANIQAGWSSAYNPRFTLQGLEMWVPGAQRS